MGMASGARTGIAVSEINVTPLIDVLLVLLILFMVIVPVTPKGLDALIPRPPKAQAEPPVGTIVVSVLRTPDGETSYRINQDWVSRAEIEPRLAQIFAARHEKTMFVTADKSLEFSKVVEIIDMGHRAQVDAIGLIAPTE